LAAAFDGKSQLCPKPGWIPAFAGMTIVAQGSANNFNRPGEKRGPQPFRFKEPECLKP
jgi:hypothetical protein